MKTTISIILILYLIPLLSYIYIKTIINNYRDKDNKKDLSGFETAKNILDKNKLDNIYIIEKRGMLVDKYYNKQKVIKLSTTSFHENTIYSLLSSSYIASHIILENNNNYVKNKLMLNPLMNFLTYIMYITLIIGICSTNNATLNLSLLLLLITIIYNIIIFFLDKIIIDNSLDNLNKLKYLSKENIEDIKTINNTLKLYNMSEIVSCLLSIFSNIKEIINDSKR